MTNDKYSKYSNSAVRYTASGVHHIPTTLAHKVTINWWPTIIIVVIVLSAVAWIVLH